ncbi:DivIVA domain-containing protein [Aliarcobacter cryaerophilus]|uniref:DivIVA domain-containing protein n=1 Tax=Aliarcobacter cryaerophilus TaxID=28198 RepID=UPI0021B53AB5|nr:DivIVA domain-containing protein [Aliarcobacter cryaerophilus]MCT7465250.1 DivIVA domain-containing protein [Aliarcobacter cryaerophilus]
MRFFLILVLPIFLFAHKVNLFLDLKDDNLYINSYFANAKPCMNCKFKIESNEKVVFEDILDEKGEYNYKTSLNDLKVIVDAGSGHTVSKKIKIQEQKNEEKIVQTEKITKDIELLLEENRVLKNQINVLEEQLNYFEIFKIVFGLLLIVVIFIILKRVKS